MVVGSLLPHQRVHSKVTPVTLSCWNLSRSCNQKQTVTAWHRKLFCVFLTVQFETHSTRQNQYPIPLFPLCPLEFRMGSTTETTKTPHVLGIQPQQGRPPPWDPLAGPQFFMASRAPSERMCRPRRRERQVGEQAGRCWKQRRMDIGTFLGGFHKWGVPQ